MALLHVNYYSPTLQMELQMDVILPERTQSQLGLRGTRSDGHCKTLYLLHGMTDDETIWQRRTSVERYAADYGIAVVMPTTHLGWYTDSPKGLRYFTATAVELPKLCRRLFPLLSPRREDTYVAGLSMGGYGALKLALRAPETFSRAAALSAAPDIVEFARRGDAALPDADPASPLRPYWQDTLGTPETAAGGFDDLFRAAEDLPRADRPPIYMWCGTEDCLLPQNLRLRDHLLALGYDLTWEASPGVHHWMYWDEKLKTVLSWLLTERQV